MAAYTNSANRTGTTSAWASRQSTVNFMKKVGDSFELSATDLVGYLNCHHLAGLDRAVADGALPKPKVWDPLLQILAERGDGP